jgi:NitT/TauT family transport system substrate-binding protein
MTRLTNEFAGQLGRRDFIARASALGTASLLGLSRPAMAEAPPETTRIRIVNFGGLGFICVAPIWVAKELLRLEGFTEISYVDFTPEEARKAQAAKIDTGADTVARDQADFTLINPVELAPTMDAGVPITVLSGVHVGCIELFGNENVRNIADLKQKRVGLRWGVPDKWFVSIMASYIGLDHAKDITWVPITDSSVPIARALAEGKIDAFLAIPPESEELRAQNVGHVVVNWAVDRPWSQYFCCMLAGSSEFVRKYPVATKRALRAILKATDLCVSDPTRVARLLVERGYTKRYEYALQAMQEIPYNRWREYDPEDSIRFYALRMHEAGFISSNPKKLIPKHTDWRFLNELKKELKA